MISIIIKNIKTAQQAAQLIQTNTTFYFWHKHLTINIRTQLCTLSFKWKQANKLRLILVRTVRFDNDPLERITDNRDMHSYCLPLCFSPPLCLQHNTSCKELAQLSHLCLCGPVPCKFPAQSRETLCSCIHYSENNREVASKDAFSVLKCWTFHWFTLQWF